jgi:hypothetical protein
MGIRDKPIAPGSPWQNGFAERLIGSIRRECVDHVIIFGEAHLRQILMKYAAYYNELRTHRSLDKDAPIHRAIQHAGRIMSAPVLGGLHHFAESSFQYTQLVPARTPREIIAALHREIVRIIALPDTTERLAALGLDPVGTTPEEFATLIKVESEKWAKVIQAANIHIKAQ